MKNYLLLIPILIVLGVVVFYMISSSPEPKKELPICTGDKDVDVTVKITDSGFEPKDLNIKQCDTVEWVNETEEEKWPASDLHPTHEIYPQFDPREPIEHGKSWSFTFDQVGEWRYHDHLFSINRAKIVVE